METNWTKLLNCLYTHEDTREYFRRGDKGITPDHPLVEAIELSPREIKDALSFLETHGLIEEDGTDTLKLTKKGFEVAREREVQEAQLRIDRRIGWLTAVLAVGAIVQAVNVLLMFTGW